MKEKTSQEKLFNHILSLTPIIEIEEKEEGLTYSGKRREYILVNRNKINFHNFKAHLDTIQKRNYLNNFCLYEISKDCDNKDNITKKEVESLDKEKNNYLPKPHPWPKATCKNRCPKLPHPQPVQNLYRIVLFD